MIRSFKDKRTEALAAGRAPRSVPADVARRAMTRLFLLDTVTRLEDLRFPLAIDWRRCRENDAGNIRSA
jgi:proteic killer suppression protein